MTNWLAGWTYRKSHIINYAAGAGTLYQKKITVHYGAGTDSGEHVYLNSHSRTDFGDVRFTDDDGSTLLDYWVEKKVDSDYATIWVEVADDLSTTAQTIYVYYGKADATTTSNGVNTFIFFDDFSGDLSKWTIFEGNVSVEAGQMKLIAATGVYSAVRSNDLLSCSSRLKLKATVSNINKYSRLGRTNAYSTSTHLPYADDGIMVECWSDATYYTVIYNEGVVTEKIDGTYDNNSHIYEFLTVSGSSGKHYKDDVLITSEHTTNVPDETMWNFFQVSGRTMYVDDVRLGKYVSPEPAHGAWGSEENPAVAHYVTVTELLGILDSKSRLKTIYRTVTELLGLQEVGRTFGYMELGTSFDVIENYIRGSVFTPTTTGLGISITVGLRGEFSDWTGKVKCAIYKHDDLSLVTNGVTEERTITLTLTPTWFTFTFPVKPSLTTNTAYILVVWAENQDYFAHIVYVTGGTNQGCYQYIVYDGFPNPLVPDGYQSRKYSIYCTINICSRMKQIYRTITELLGFVDDKTVLRAIHIVVTDEDLSASSGYAWDEVTYTATVLDSVGNKLPATIEVDLTLDGILVIDGQPLNSGVYNQSTGLLTLVWYVPTEVSGDFTIKLKWVEQTI